MGQLPLAWMGILALAILWTNALLVFLAAWKDRSLLSTQVRGARSARSGTVGATEGGAELARFEIEQVGRAADATDVRTILFHDKRHSSTLRGGTVVFDGGETLELAKDEAVEVWVSRDALTSRIRRLEEGESYAKAYEAATKGAGFQRVVDVPLERGTKVFTWKDGDVRVLANFDPKPLLQGHRASVTLFMLGTLVGALVVTAIALVPPPLGLVSKLGGVLGLGYFLGVTPIGVSLREKIRKPSMAFIRGAWTDPEGKATPERVSV